MDDNEIPNFPELLPTRTTDYMSDYMTDGTAPPNTRTAPTTDMMEVYRQPQRQMSRNSATPIEDIVEQFKRILSQIDQQVQLTEQFGKRVSDALWETYCDEIDKVWTKYTDGQPL